MVAAESCDINLAYVVYFKNCHVNYRPFLFTALLYQRRKSSAIISAYIFRPVSYKNVRFSLIFNLLFIFLIQIKSQSFGLISLREKSTVNILPSPCSDSTDKEYPISEHTLFIR